MNTCIEKISELLDNKNILGIIMLFFFMSAGILMQYDLMYMAWFSVICAGAIIIVISLKS